MHKATGKIMEKRFYRFSATNNNQESEEEKTLSHIALHIYIHYFIVYAIGISNVSVTGKFTVCAC